MKRKRLLVAIGAGVVLYLLLRRKASAATAPAVAGVVSSGSQSVTIDTNVLSPTFGEPISN